MLVALWVHTWYDLILRLRGEIMLAYTFVEPGKFALLEKPKPVLINPHDAIVRVTLASICSSDIHIKHGAVPRAVPGITLAMKWLALWRLWGQRLLM